MVPEPSVGPWIRWGKETTEVSGVSFDAPREVKRFWDGSVTHKSKSIFACLNKSNTNLNIQDEFQTEIT
jgi:hypothetical protein